MVPLAQHNLALISLQYELALLIGQDLRLGPMLRRFFPPALKALGCRAAHVWLRDGETLRPAHRFAYPARDAAALQTDPELAAAVTAYQDSSRQARQTGTGAHTQLYFAPLHDIGFCMLVREGRPLAAEVAAALTPILDRLSTACQACLDHEETERLRALAAEREFQLRTVVDTVGEAIFQTDPAGRLTFLNSAWHRITGFAIEACLGSRLCDFLCTQDDRTAADALRTFLDGRDGSLRLKARLRTADGSRPWVGLHIERHHPSDAAYIGTTGTLVDITEQHRMIEELIRARASAEEASKAKSAFLANMSHEIRTPMNAVIGLTQLTLDEAVPAQARGHLQAILGSAEHLLTIINDILDFSKIEAGRLEFVTQDFDLHALLDEIVATMRVSAQAKGLALLMHVDGGVPQRVRGDATRLKQVLLNLLGNAVKFTDEGSVGLVIDNMQTETNGHLLRFGVIDTGVGISADKHQRIFEPFSQADESIDRAFGGTGLGLTICRRLVGMMHGTLNMTSEPGKGSEFSFTAHFQRSGAVADRTGIVPGGAPDQGPSSSAARALDVLVAEDNDVNRRLMKGLLSRLGHRIHFAHDGQAAVDACAGTRFDVVLMDVQMPVMDGLTATREIRRIEAAAGLAAMPIIALTANAMQGDRERCLESGMTGYLTKPLRRHELELALESITRAGLPDD